MIRVEAPPDTIAPPPVRARPFPWLEAAAVAVIASAFLPWERWCTEDPAGLGERCFTAGLWSGSASLAGMAAAFAAAVLIVVSIRSRGNHPTSSRTTVFTVLLATIAVKLVLTAENETVADQANFPASDLGAGFWVGLVLAIGSLLALVASMDLGSRSRRRVLAHASLALAVVGLAIPYAWSGLAWWGGPLVHPHSLGGGNGAGYVVRPGEPQLFQSLLYVRNRGRLGLTLDGLEVMDPSGQIRILGTYVTCFERCPSDPVDLDVERASAGRLYPLDGYRLEPMHGNRSVLLAILFEVPRPGVYRSGWFRIRYHVGPLRYEAFRTDELVICAPEPGQTRCRDTGS